MSSPTVSTEALAITFADEDRGYRSFYREQNFLDSKWDFVRLADGRAFWIHASGKKIPASGNREE